MKTSKQAFASFVNARGLRSKLVAAFTLIEILIVVAIIGIILGIAVPALNTAREDALATKRSAVIAQVATAKIRYYLANPTVANTTVVTYANIQPYLTVNGQTSPAQNALLAGTGMTNIVIGNDSTQVSLN